LEFIVAVSFLLLVKRAEGHLRTMVESWKCSCGKSRWNLLSSQNFCVEFGAGEAGTLVANLLADKSDIDGGHVLIGGTQIELGIDWCFRALLIDIVAQLGTQVKEAERLLQRFVRGIWYIISAMHKKHTTCMSYQSSRAARVRECSCSQHEVTVHCPY
jgi:hypothetical protein